MIELSNIKNVVVVGAGVMGSGIAQVTLMAGYNVTLVDINKELVNKGVVKIKEGLNKVEAKGKLGEGVLIAELLAKCKKSIDLASAVRDADFVFEAIVEKMDVKKNVCDTVMTNSPSHCIFASNTSTLSITEIAESSQRPDHVIGMHFFLPVILQCCVEVMKGEKTSNKSLDIAVALGEKLPCLKGKRFTVRIEKESLVLIVCLFLHLFM
jgi:enoyl-CoA hydratase/3-hydroxyacyl-CoA dehydrogenase